jgi:DivIVA domain-containing protein
VALERQSIERKDFPIGRRGYDPDAVDAHLSELADEVEELKRSARKPAETRPETLASSASDHVRSIVEAAESSAAQIRRQAEEQAREIRSEATQEAHMTREHASAEANEYVGRVSESTASMLQRLEAMENELNSLVESLRTGTHRLDADLQVLESNFAEVRETVTVTPTARSGAARVSDQSASAVAEPEGPAEIEQLGDSSGHEEPSVGVQAPLREQPAVVDEAPLGDPAAADAHAAAGAHAAADDIEGARLIALNMALNGSPREETDRYLADNFQLGDRAALLDEVYASFEG